MANGILALHCSWDGSLHPDIFMDLIEKPGTTLTPTDKSYKVYIDVDAAVVGDDPHELRVVGSISGGPPTDTPPRGYTAFKGKARRIWKREGNHGDYKPRWVMIGERGPRREDKFYFEHLSTEQRIRFIELLNANKLTLREPGYFYALPFFMTREKASV